MCSWSFISVKRHCFLYSWHKPVPCSPCFWAFSAWYLSSEPTVQQLSSPRMHSAYIYSLSAIFLLWICLRSWVRMPVRGALSLYPVQLLSVSLPPAGGPEALAGDKKKDAVALLWKTRLRGQQLRRNITAFISLGQKTFRRSCAWNIFKELVRTSYLKS